MSEARLTPSPEQWAEVEAALSSPYGSAQLQCDTFDLTLQVVTVKVRRQEICVYIGGVWKGAWIVNDCEERRRFFRPTKWRVYSRATAAKLKRFYKGKERAELDKMLTHYMPTWPSFAPLRRHLLKHSQAVRILKVNGKEVQQ